MYYGIENPHGGDIYERDIRLDFSANVNPFGTPESVTDAAAKALALTEYYPDPFCRELVRKISAKQDVPEKMIYAGSGASELIYAYALGMKFGKAVIVSPTFVEYKAALSCAGTECVPYICKKENGFLPDGGLFDFLENERPGAVFICNPNNPTGRTVSRHFLEQLLEMTSKMNTHLFVDECFYELSDSRVTVKGQLSTHDNLFILRAFTKSFALASLRLGYCMCGNAETLRKMSSVTPPWSVSGPAQAAGLVALEEDRFVEDSVKKLHRERKYLAAGLKEAGIKVYPSEVNYIFIEARKDLRERLREQGIEIRSCANYDGLQPGYFRIAVRLRRDNEKLIRAVNALRQAD